MKVKFLIKCQLFILYPYQCIVRKPNEGELPYQMSAVYFQRLLLFDALDMTFRTIKLRPRQTSCLVCGDNPTITELIDYEQFCGAGATDKV